jgi:probable F420-dependent oxidoreductase
MKIGVHIRTDERAVSSYTEIREQALAAEEAGFDSIWLFDHLLFRDDEGSTRGMWECWTLLSALAEATNRVEIAPLVLCNPFRNPALLAKMAHTLDEVSQGRLILGVGAGWNQPEFDAFGFSFKRRVDRFEEALQILKPLLRGETVDFEGVHYQARDCEITPVGPRPQGIPLLVGAEGPRMLRLTARYADQWNVPLKYRPQDLPDQLARIRNACADVGRDPSSLVITIAAYIVFPDLGETGSWSGEGEPLGGSATELAQAFRGFERSGVDHLICALQPASELAFQRLAESLHIYRKPN